MSFKILEQNGVENEVADGGALNNFCAGNRDGIIAGVLSECALSAAGNGVAISPGLLIICGVRIKITASETLYVSSVPLKATRYQIIAQVTLGADGNTSAEFFLQSNASLKRDAIYAQGYGTYQAEIGSFTHNPDGSISDMVRTLDVLYGGGNGSANIEVGNVVTQTLPAGQDAEFDMTARNENGKTIFDVKALIPRGASGTDEEAVHFTPQTLTEAQKAQARANINALSAAEADIQHIAVDCDHEYEITGYTGHEWNVAVPDQCQLTVTKIKGRTSRKSPNLLKPLKSQTEEKSGVTYTFNNDGSIFINGSAQNASGDEYISDIYTVTLQAGKTYSTYIFTDGKSSELLLDAWIDNVNYRISNYYVNVFTFPKNVTFTFRVVQRPGFSANNNRYLPILTEGEYTAETMPAYQPFDDTLVNSKVKRVISTGANLCPNSGAFSKFLTDVWDVVAIIPTIIGQSYSFTISNFAQRNDGQGGLFVFGYDNTTPDIPDYPNLGINQYYTFEYDGASEHTISRGVTAKYKYLFFGVRARDNKNISWDHIMVNYGASSLPYEPYISDDTFGVDKEITGFGEIDNVSKQHMECGSANVITLDGSADEVWIRGQTITSDHWRFVWVNSELDSTAAGGADNINCISNWLDGTPNQTRGGVTCLSVDGHEIQICNESIETVEELRAWLAANPIQFIYRLATPRIQTTVDIPAGYSAHKGGLQQQVIEGDYLPYIITKDYPVSGADQILKNLEIDRDQGKMLDAIRQGALPVGKLANAITIISGDTKKTFDGSTPVEITASGEAGPPGERGEQGVPGEAATITIRNVDVGTALPGQPATVVIKNVGTSTNAILDFGFMIPRGEPGEQGERGEQGVPGNSSLMSVVIMNPVIGGSSYYGRILLTCPVPSTGIPNNGFENLIPALKYQDYQVSGIISLDQNTLNAKRVYGLRKLASNGNKLYALIDSQTISAVVDGEELTGASAVVFGLL